MPVTAKLSRKFYETFGHELVAELVDLLNQVDATYRADLRELNELNFARFDAKMAERFVAETNARFDNCVDRARFERFAAETTARLDNCVDRATFERRISELEARLTRRMYAVTTASLLAQVVALVTLLRFFAVR